MNGLSEMKIHEIVIWYLAIINVIAIAVYGWDKMCEIRHKWRVPEKTLSLFISSKHFMFLNILDEPETGGEHL